MGLDSYLVKYPRIEGATPKDMRVVAEQCNWYKYNLNHPDNHCTFHDYAGYDEEDIPKQPLLGQLRTYLKYVSYGNWTKVTIEEDIAYWRKLWFLHSWFVHNVQDDIDDCEYHHEVTLETLQILSHALGESIEHTNIFFYYFPDDRGYDEEELKVILPPIKEEIDTIINTTDFTKEQIYYISSW